MRVKAPPVWLIFADDSKGLNDPVCKLAIDEIDVHFGRRKQLPTFSDTSSSTVRWKRAEKEGSVPGGSQDDEYLNSGSL